MKKKSDWQLNNLFNKKGDIWVSAVLYFGLGIVVLTLVLTTGMPVINRLRDKNVGTQTKDVFATLDENIRQVARGGPGTQRVLQIGITKGELKVYDAKNPEKVEEIKIPGTNNPNRDSILNSLSLPGALPDTYLAGTDGKRSAPNRIAWTYQLKAALTEPDVLVQEGNTNILTLGQGGAYDLRYWLDYEPNIYLNMVGGVGIISGNTKISIKNLGSRCKCATDSKPDPVDNSKTVYGYTQMNSNGECDIATTPESNCGVTEQGTKPRITISIQIV